MNIFFLFDDGSLVTPPLTGTILPGITRASVIALAAGARGMTVREEPYAIDQWQRRRGLGTACARCSPAAPPRW